MSESFKFRYEIDQLDRDLIRALRDGDRPSNAELARTLNLARGTVSSRLARLVERGVITGWGPDIASSATDHKVLAFATLSIAQGAHDRVTADLERIPEILEVHVITGAGDLLCRIAARSNDHLHELIQQIIATKGVLRSESQLALSSPIQRTIADLFSTRGAS